MARYTGRSRLQFLNILCCLQHTAAARLVKRGAAVGELRMASIQTGFRLGRRQLEAQAEHPPVEKGQAADAFGPQNRSVESEKVEE